MAQFWHIVNEILDQSDIVILVADARVPESVNQEVLSKIKRLEKKYLIVYNKVDLLSFEERDLLNSRIQKDDYTMMLSAKEHDRTMRLLRRITGLARGKHVLVGVVGYPNTGKSSLINALKGRHSASVSSQAGHTKGVQKVRVSQKITLLDSPGVIPFSEKYSFVYQAVLSAKSPNQLKDPESAVLALIEYLEGRVESFYGVEPSSDYEEVIEAIALSLNILKSGGVPDTKRVAVRILQDWQNGKILL